MHTCLPLTLNTLCVPKIVPKSAILPVRPLLVRSAGCLCPDCHRLRRDGQHSHTIFKAPAMDWSTCQAKQPNTPGKSLQYATPPGQICWAPVPRRSASDTNSEAPSMDWSTCQAKQPQHNGQEPIICDPSWPNLLGTCAQTISTPTL